MNKADELLIHSCVTIISWWLSRIIYLLILCSLIIGTKILKNLIHSFSQKVRIFQKGQNIRFNEYESWTLKSQCFSSQILELVHIYHSNICSVSVVVSLFLLFFITVKKTNLQFSQNENLSLRPFVKKWEWVSLFDLFLVWVYSRIARWSHAD